MNQSATPLFEQVIDLQAASGDLPDQFIGPPAPERDGRTYGGQFLAQAVVAGYRTVSAERRLHSLHAYFLRPGSVDRPTHWEVELMRDGRSFASRSISGSQQGKEVFRMLASFHTPEDGFEYRPGPGYPISSLPSPDEVTLSYVDYCEQQPDHDPEAWFGQDRPMDIRYINPPTQPEGVAITEPQLTWTRLLANPSPDHVIQHAGLAYLADSTLVDHVLLPHGHRWHDIRLTGTSLDHAMWFQAPCSPTDWLLYDQRVESTGGARGLASGRFYTQSGELVASCSQEGLIRWAENR